VRGVALVLLLVLTACAAEPRADFPIQPLALRLERTGGTTRLVLTAASGWKINARLKPALETTEGSIIRFDAARLTPDSAYFAEPPSAVLPQEVRTVAGRLRASVCATGERVCRVVTLMVRGEQGAP
jgi:hypothetical protein